MGDGGLEGPVGVGRVDYSETYLVPFFIKVEAVIEKIIEVARTGEIGDGKIFRKLWHLSSMFGDKLI